MLPKQTKTANSQGRCKTTKTLSGENNVYSFLHMQYALSSTVPVDNSMHRQRNIYIPAHHTHISANLYVPAHIHTCTHTYAACKFNVPEWLPIIQFNCPRDESSAGSTPCSEGWMSWWMSALPTSSAYRLHRVQRTSQDRGRLPHQFFDVPSVPVGASTSPADHCVEKSNCYDRVVERL